MVKWLELLKVIDLEVGMLESIPFVRTRLPSFVKLSLLRLIIANKGVRAEPFRRER